MTQTESPTDLTGRILIAMPGMADPRFDKSVVFLCAHSDDGAMGLIVNKPAMDLALDDLLKQLDIAPGAASRDRAVFFGGPVESGRGFVLHSDEYGGNDSTLKVDGGFALTATRDILEDIGRGQGPGAILAALGYAGWGPGQLESELQQNAWLTCDADREIVFSPDPGGIWAAALSRLGIDPLMLSAEGGRA